MIILVVDSIPAVLIVSLLVRFGFPPGSVVASVDVYFETFETYMNRVETEEISDEKEMSRNYKTKWTFESCISGK